MSQTRLMLKELFGLPCRTRMASLGVAAPKGAAALGDVLVFKRKGGGNVGLYVGHDASALYVLGGNHLITSRSHGCRTTGS